MRIPIAVSITLELVLAAGALWAGAGTVVDKDDNPIAGAKVTVVFLDFQKLLAAYRTVGECQGEEVFRGYSDAEGNFSFADREGAPKSDFYYVTAVAPGHTFGFDQQLCSQDEEVIIKLWPERILKGEVVDENGRSLAGSAVCLDSYSGFSSIGSRRSAFSRLGCGVPGQAETVTDTNGKFALLHIPDPAEFPNISLQVTVTAEGRALIRKRFRDKELLGKITIAQPLECRLRGKLYLPGKTGPAPDGTVLLAHVAGELLHQPRRATVDSAGAFEFAQLPPGKVSVTPTPADFSFGEDNEPAPAEPADWTLAAITNLEIASKETKSIDLVLVTGALIRGRVTEEKTGDPVPNAQMIVYHAGQPKDVTYGDRVVTDQNGEFAARVAPGKVWISIESAMLGGRRATYYNEQDRTMAEFQVADGEQKSGVDLKLKPPALAEDGYDLRFLSEKMPEDFELKAGEYALAWDPEVWCDTREWYPRGYTETQAPRVKSLITNLPKLVSEKPWFIGMRVDGNRDQDWFLVVLDESAGTGKGYDVVYADLNRNHDLGDDQPLKLEISSRGSDGATDWAAATFYSGPPEGERVANSGQVKFEYYSRADDPMLKLDRRGTWKGVIESSAGSIECIAVDSNSNGIYGEVTAAENEQGFTTSIGDDLYADTNGSGRAVVSSMSPNPHAIRLCKLSQVGRKFYSIRVSPVGDRLTIEPYEGATGRLLVRADNVQGQSATFESVRLMGTNGYYEFRELDEKPVVLPVGVYKMGLCSLSLKRTRGPRNFGISCRWDATAEIRPNEDTTLVLGGKLSLAIDPAKRTLVYRPGGNETISWIVKIGENVELTGLGDYRDNPEVKFYNKAGKLVSKAAAAPT